MGNRSRHNPGLPLVKVCRLALKKVSGRTRKATLVTLLALVPVLVIAFLMIDSRRTTSADCMNSLIAQSIGNKEKAFLSERFGSEGSVALYKDAIDRELEMVTRGEHSALLEEKLLVAPVEVSSVSLATDYARNAMAADARYAQQSLLVSGQVQDIELDNLDAPYISLKGVHALRDVQLTFAPQREIMHYLSGVRLSTTHKFFCKTDGLELKSIGLRDCTPAAIVYQRIAEDYKRTCVLKITYGQLFNRLDKQSNPVLYSQALELLLKSEYAVTHFPECRAGSNAACLMRLNKVQIPSVIEWLKARFAENGINLLDSADS